MKTQIKKPVRLLAVAVSLMSLSAMTTRAATQTVTIQNLSFQPSAVSIQVGDAVTWMQQDSVQHTSTSDATPPVWDSGLLSMGQTFSFTFMAPGTFPYHCTVHPFMKAGITVAQVAATNMPPVVQITSPANGATVTLPTNVTITATASDPDGTIAKVEFFDGALTLGTLTTAPFSVIVSNFTTGAHTVTAKATDDKGATTTSAAVMIQVNAAAANQPPVVQIASPANGAAFTAPTNVTITATASDPDGTVTQVEFLDGTNMLGHVTSAPYTFTITNATVGEHVLIVRATDNQGAVTTSESVSIQVNSFSFPYPAVMIQGYSFVPPMLQIQVGQTVTWIQQDPTRHTTTSDFKPPTWDSGLLAMGQTFSFTFNNSGNFPYHCTVHPYMQGGIAVPAGTNFPPTVRILRPSGSAVFPAPANISIEVAAAQTNGGIAHVLFFLGATNQLADVTQAPFSLTWSNVPAGTYELLTEAVDIQGISAVSVPVTIRVSTAAAYRQHNLVSDLPGMADNTDTNLANPWGFAFSPTGPFWVSDSNTGRSTVYDSTGGVQSLVVTVPAAGGAQSPGAPTGIIFYGGSNFLVAPNLPSHFIFATADGTISGWNSGASAVVKVDVSAAHSSYVGLALGHVQGKDYLYAADFHNAKIDVYDDTFQVAKLAGSFADTNLPPNFAPFGIQNVASNLYVSYALQDTNKQYDIPGAGNGYVDMYDLNGNLVKRVASGGALNSPWAMVQAPEGFGPFSSALLVGNFGDGHISVFDFATGAYLTTLVDTAKQPIAIEGLWDLKVGNGGRGGDVNRLYFTAGISGGGAIASHGLFGSLSAISLARFDSIVDNGSTVTLQWEGGYGRYTLQSKASLMNTNWLDVITTPDLHATVPKGGSTEWFRLLDEATSTGITAKGVPTY